MIVVMEPGATEEQVAATVKRVESLGLKASVIVGTERTVVAAIGNKREHFKESLESADGVSAVLPIVAPYKMASRERSSINWEVSYTGPIAACASSNFSRTISRE